MTVLAADRADLSLVPFVTRHLFRPLALLIAEFALYAVAVVDAVLLTPLWEKLLLSVVAGVLVSTLAIIGHDCAHRGGTRYSWLNRLIGTIGFLPALHPLSRWAFHHNQVHHRYTAQIGVDNAYPPMSVAGYRAASPGAQAYYRFQRSVWGQPLFYLIDIWARDIFLPRGGLKARDYLDFALVYLWLATLLAGLTWLSHSYGATPGWGMAFANAAVFGVVIPFLVWNLFISFVTVIQHTGPRVKWSMPTGRPSTPAQKLHGTVRIRFPEMFDVLFHRLMQHSAHHLNPIIPMYSLKAAQRSLEESHGEEVISVRWTPAYHMQLVRSCKLYDTERDCWCDFDFQPTTPPAH
ncbi:MAG TPA: fatty acid desaturase [Rhizomicrobium sp.]|nr:fatty acid desaturase [Rhizomicrobium sp.]